MIININPKSRKDLIFQGENPCGFWVNIQNQIYYFF